ncbi:MAG: SRPBCC domain-containing protein [Acidobacteriia bacterium]|nr:SRPBCC domain-containing protein [Terriglobia bacterium]
MATTIITPDLDVIVSEIDIAAPPERVFKAISDPVEIRRRSPSLAVYEMDARVGGAWYLEMRPPQPYKGVAVIRHDGEILEIDPPRLLVYTWLANFHNDPKRRSIVRWELTPTKDGTHVKLTHSGLATEPVSAKDYAGGWPGVLDDLKSAVEGVK